MSFIGYQLLKSNPDNQAIAINSGDEVIFATGNIAEPIDPTISYDGGTGIFTFTSGGTYYVSWFVNLQTDTGMDASFAIEAADNSSPAVVIATYPASSVFKTGQLSGSALLTVPPNGKIRLINNSLGTATLAIGTGMITAGITLLGSLGGDAAQVYLNGQVTSNLTISNGSKFPYDVPGVNQVSGPITIDTTSANKGVVTIAQAGTYIVDWWTSIAAATQAKEIVLQLIDNSNTILGSSYHAVTTVSHVSGFAVVHVTPAQASAGYSFALYNKTVKTNGNPTALELYELTLCSALRVSIIS